MTKDQALYSFFNSFDIPAYPNTAVPEEAKPPYLTYTSVFGSFGYPVSLTINLWYRTESEAIPNAKAQEICDKIGNGYYVKIDNGAILFTVGSPAYQSVTEEDITIKRRYMNITAEYITLT